MLICTTGARHSKSLEPLCQRTACLRGKLNVLCVHFSRKLRVVDIKRGYVGRYEERFAQGLERRCQRAVCFQAAIIQGVH